MEDTRGSRREAGFSLVELLVVIVVLGILAAVVVFSVRGLTDRGELSSCAEDRRILETAAESYFAQHRTSSLPVSDPPIAGVSGVTPEGTLFEVGLLAMESDLHDVDSAGVVTPSAGSRC